MKYIIIFLMAAGTVCTCYGQNTSPWPSSGNIGIGTTNPGGKALYVRANSAGDHSAVIENISSTGYGLIVNSSNDPLRVGPLGDYNGNYLKVSGNGNVGIGTTNPGNKLDINAAGMAGLNVFGNTSSYVGSDINVSRSSTSSGVGRGATLQFNDHGSGSYNIIQSSSEGLQIFNNYNGWGWYERIRIKDNGHVGIGTTTPLNLLDVNGTIHAKEVKIDLNGWPGPDYVFEKDYPLTSLEELESYIDQNKHLPEIPSAKEMEENGINLKEMNLLLLKKVEELTLHLIEQNNQLKKSQMNAEVSLKKVDELMLHLIELERKNGEQDALINNLINNNK